VLAEKVERDKLLNQQHQAQNHAKGIAGAN